LINDTRLIVIGGSAGSLQVMFKLFAGMDNNYPIPIVVIIHRSQSIEPLLEDLLASKTKMRVKEAEEKEMPEPGWLYICPADYHLLFEKDGSFTLDYSEKVNFCRPSIDVGFQSAADVFGAKLMCILLSGANADGAEGLAYVKQQNGITIVQDPMDAEVSYMPQMALQRNQTDHVLGAKGIRSFLESLML
jgi:two-component system, chemotaxis family, protein-glutamate methylesterase/glutaminase